MTKEEKASIIARAVSSRQGRVRLAHSMVQPLAPAGMVGPRSSILVCDGCALKNSDCEKIRPQPPNGKTCQVPEGTIYVWEEREAKVWETGCVGRATGVWTTRMKRSGRGKRRFAYGRG